MWSPTHAVVVVRRAENLLIKGKNGTNNAFVVIKLGDDTYKTSTLDNSGKSVSWHEECELKIPDSGNTASVVLKVMHRNHLGMDQLIGIARIPLSSFDKDQRSVEWFKLEGKQKTAADKHRGILEVEIGFIAREEHSQSLASASQSKGKFSMDRIAGSLFGLNHAQNLNKKFKLKTIATSWQKNVLRKKKSVGSSVENTQEEEEPAEPVSVSEPPLFAKCAANLDPGVNSDDEETYSNRSFGSTNALPTDNTSGYAVSVASNSSVPYQGSYQNYPQINISFYDSESEFHNMSTSDLSGDGTIPEHRRKSPKLGELQNMAPSDRRFSSSCVDIAHLSGSRTGKTFSSSFHLEVDPAESPNKLSRLARKFKSFQSVDKKELKRTVIGCETGEKYEESTVPTKSDFKNKNKDELIRMVIDLQKRINSVSLRVKDLEDYLDVILLKVMDTMPKILEKS